MRDQSVGTSFGIRFTPRRERRQLVDVGKFLLTLVVISLCAFAVSNFLESRDWPNAAGLAGFVAIGATLFAAIQVLVLISWLVDYFASSRLGLPVPQLFIDKHGIVETSAYARTAHAWLDISDFEVIEIHQAEDPTIYRVIAFGKDQVIPLKPRHKYAEAKLILDIPGFDRGGQHQQEILCQWFNLWRRWAIADGAPPTLADLDFIEGDVKAEIVPARL